MGRSRNDLTILAVLLVEIDCSTGVILLIYILVFSACAMASVLRIWRQGETPIWIVAAFIFLTIFVGYRFEIGVDWITYEIMFLDLARYSLSDALSSGDAAYSLLNWLVARSGGQVWHVNLICAAIFCYGLMLFCRSLPRPALALALALPTLVIVAAMGYTRQAVAAACIMLAFQRFEGGVNWRWLAWLCLGVLFHRSTIILFPAFILAGSRQKWLGIIFGGALAAIVLVSVVAKNLGDVIALYFEGDIESSGALPRVVVGAIAGSAYFIIRGRAHIFGERDALLKNTSLMLISLVPMYFIVPSSTVIDRIGILLVPFQSAVYAGLVASLEERPFFESVATLVLLLAYGALLVVWLLFATFAEYWLPYENVLFQKWI